MEKILSLLDDYLITLKKLIEIEKKLSDLLKKSA